MEYLVQKFELDLLDPHTRKSKIKLEKLLADDFFEFTQSGAISTKQDIIEILPTVPEEEFAISDYQEKILSSDIVLVHYIADRFVPSNGLNDAHYAVLSGVNMMEIGK